ncbi:MAG: ABC transporter ATP-binding protein [Firmicutes bacterium]|nr:ABC transporter ATP-binding protein [Bacillota bacterium]
MIKINQLSKSFDKFKVLDNLQMHVPKGSIYGLVGPNGAGKSTLIRHITGVYRPDAGEILVDGAPVYENTEVKKHMSVIPDEIYYYLQASTYDMMRFYRGLYPRFDTERYRKLGEIFAFDEKRLIRKLSKGMQKQAAFRLALSARPDLLILDEPVDGLDPVMRRQIWSLVIGDVAENGTTVLVSSHNLRELEDVCDHVGIIHQGRLMLERPLSELQGGTLKVQLMLPEGVTEPPAGLKILHRSAIGRVETWIVRGEREQIEAGLAELQPVFYDLIPLSLEEIFIYEMGGADYAIHEILL